MRRIICPHTRVSFNELDTVLLGVSRLYRCQPPKCDGRLLRASLDPFYQILAGDLTQFQRLFQIGVDAYLGYNLYRLNKVVQHFRMYVYTLKKEGRPKLGSAYYHFCSKWARVHLSKLKVYQDTFEYNVQKRLIPSLIKMDLTIM